MKTPKNFDVPQDWIELLIAAKEVYGSRYGQTPLAQSKRQYAFETLHTAIQRIYAVYNTNSDLHIKAVEEAKKLLAREEENDLIKELEQFNKQSNSITK